MPEIFWSCIDFSLYTAYQCGDSHYEDTYKDGLYLETGPNIFHSFICFGRIPQLKNTVYLNYFIYCIYVPD